jgi:hypothetical protein
MKIFFGVLFILIGLSHGLHVIGIEPGSISSLNAGSPLSNASLDRVAATGLFGKLAVISIDIAFIALGVYELLRKPRNKR